MRRYKFLDKDSVYGALNRLRSSFLAAKDGKDVEKIIKAILTHDERMKIGRRIQIAEMIKQGALYRQIAKELKVGLTTVLSVAKKLDQNPDGFELIMAREAKVEKEFKHKAYSKGGSSKLIFRSKKYSGFTRKDVKR